MKHADPAIQFLLNSSDPSIRYFTLVDLLGKSNRSRDVKAARDRILEGPRVKVLLAGQHIGKQKSKDSFGIHPGGFGVHPYKKWDGAQWRLVSLVELGVPAKEPRAVTAADQVLYWLTSEFHRSKIKAIEGRVRRCGSQEGNPLAVCSRLGLIDDPRVQYLAESLIKPQVCYENPRHRQRRKRTRADLEDRSKPQGEADFCCPWQRGHGLPRRMCTHQGR